MSRAYSRRKRPLPSSLKCFPCLPIKGFSSYIWGQFSLQHIVFNPNSHGSWRFGWDSSLGPLIVLARRAGVYLMDALFTLVVRFLSSSISRPHAEQAPYYLLDGPRCPSPSTSQRPAPAPPRTHADPEERCLPAIRIARCHRVARARLLLPEIPANQCSFYRMGAPPPFDPVAPYPTPERPRALSPFICTLLPVPVASPLRPMITEQRAVRARSALDTSAAPTVLCRLCSSVRTPQSPLGLLLDFARLDLEAASGSPACKNSISTAAMFSVCIGPESWSARLRSPLVAVSRSTCLVSAEDNRL
ncbi:hypothetical protein DFH09DRAFT_1460704 [Mycena vulgaris]|nr:hypothetical protein DFH09DRAFT_1460704 [Mycena vulgaris]